MASLLQRPVARGLIGALALMIVASVPAYGQYERGPTIYQFENTECSGAPSNVVQMVPNSTLDLGLGACVNTSDPGSPSSVRTSCDNGEVRFFRYLESDDCTGGGIFTSYATNLCFPGTLDLKRDEKVTRSFGKSFASLPAFSVKRLPGDESTVFVCNPGETWTLVANAPMDTSVPELASPEPTPCSSPGNCTTGAATVSLYNATGRLDPTCDQALLSQEFMSGAVIGACYVGGDSNVRVGCSADSVYYDLLAWGCNNPWIQRFGEVLPVQHDQCTRYLDSDFKFFCPSAVGQPLTPSAAALHSPRLALAFLAIAFIAVASFL